MALALARSRWSRMALLVLALAPAASAQLEQRVIDLRPKFTAGQQTKFKMEVANTSTSVGGPKAAPVRPGPGSGRPQPAPATPAAPSKPDQTKSSIQMGISLKVKEATGDGATVDLVFDSIKMSTTTADGVVEFDSTKPSKPSGDPLDIDPVAMMLQPLVGSTLTMKVSPSGNITSISGGEAFMALGQFMGGGGGGTGGAGQLFGPLFNIKKGNGLAHIGESWEDEDNIDNGLMGKFKMITRHRLVSAAGSKARVDMTGRIEPSSEAGSATIAQVKNSGFTGHYTWDTAAGMLDQMDSSMSVEMQTSVDGKPGTTRNESTMKVTKVR